MKPNVVFLQKLGEKYEEIKKLFIVNMKKEKMEFDEDLFQETLIKCSETYKDDVNDMKKIKAYFWVAFRTNTIKKLSRQKHFEDIDEIDFDIIDEEYNPDVDEFVDIAKQELYDKFGEGLTNLWLRHVCESLDYEDIEKESGITNVHYQFKRIRKYIREEIPEKNPRFKELMRTLR